MQPNGTQLENLTRDACLRLIKSVAVGRIIYTRQAMPAVELVNFAVDSGDIVIRTNRSGKLAAAVSGAVVAFEVDHLDPGNKGGWSVTAIGRSREVTDPADADRLRGIGLSAWAPGEREHFIRISPEILNGRMLHAPDLEPEQRFDQAGSHAPGS
jgi:nitroimidazol reductase NimA-like FMN-containing flavoprotein (pyridoxamine 5'-phosphate oxidase superfamily)